MSNTPGAASSGGPRPPSLPPPTAPSDVFGAARGPVNRDANAGGGVDPRIGSNSLIFNQPSFGVSPIQTDSTPLSSLMMGRVAFAANVPVPTHLKEERREPLEVKPGKPGTHSVKMDIDG